MKSFQEWRAGKNEVSKPAAAGAGFLLGGPVGALIGHQLGQDEKKTYSPSKPERKSSGGRLSQNMVNLSPEELLQKGVIEGEIIKDITDRTGARSIETRWANGVKSTKFIGRANQVPQAMVKLGPEELLQQGIIQGEVIKDETNDRKERWITTKSKSGIETIKYIGQNW